MPGGDSAIVEELGLRLEAAQEETALLLDVGGPERRGVLVGGMDGLQEDAPPGALWVKSKWV